MKGTRCGSARPASWLVEAGKGSSGISRTKRFPESDGCGAVSVRGWGHGSRSSAALKIRVLLLED